ncbi:FMN-binding protein [Paenibacillus sp. FSL R5-0887]|uniref:FMN-binding protein n=1 Tax=Paenibacillus TaxID=44249 RepID=UPI00096BEEB3|nr:FMN-binding protein [Paenibacillus odorifer]OMD94465.1 FMN-binding protein [Paenibacillus odorifer]OME08413.1 FMN-binding protein [Paenibacillus odorifer]
MSKRRGKKRKFNKWIIVLSILCGITVIGWIGGILLSAPGRHEVQQLTIHAIDIQKLREGSYVGEYIGIKDHSRDTKVKATISAGRLSDIKILKGALDNTGNPAELKGGLSIGDLFGHVIESQSLQVDVISGATLTSKTHLKALENALLQAETK